MYKILNLIMILLIFFFIFSIFQYYSSTKNIEIKNYNRDNADYILKKKITDLPILKNNTNNIIEFNNSLENNRNNEKKRSFWELLKNK